MNRRLILGGVICFVALGLVLACFREPSDPSAPSAPQPTAPQVGATGCTYEDVLKVLDAIKGPNARFSDASDLVLSASSSSLTTIASDMQAARRDLVDAEMPTCGEPVRQRMSAGMDATIDGVVFLQAGASEAAADKFDEAARINTQLADDIKFLNP